MLIKYVPTTTNTLKNNIDSNHSLPHIPDNNISLTEEEYEDVNELIFDHWQNMSDVNWNMIEFPQNVILFPTNDEKKLMHAFVNSIELSTKTVQFTFIHDCWWSCNQSIHMSSDEYKIFIVKRKTTSPDTEQQLHISDMEFSEIMNVLNELNDKHKYLISGLNSQQENIEISLANNFTNYLDQKMKSLEFRIFREQESFMEQHLAIISNEEQLYNESQMVSNIEQFYEYIDEKIDSKVCIFLYFIFRNILFFQLNEKFEQFEKLIMDGVQQEMEDFQKLPTLPTSNLGTKYDNDLSNEFDFSYKVVRHSSLLSGNLESFGQYIVQQWMGKWNQQSIMDTFKPGDCTPLRINPQMDTHPYIVISLQRSIIITNFSLFHYPMHLLPKSAINSATKEFQISVKYCISVNV